MREKSVFLSCIICCLLLQANAQTLDSNTIVNSNSSWATLEYGLWTPGYVVNEYIYFDGDSIVTDSLYKKVFSCNDSLRQNIKYEGLIREHEKKTYFIPAKSDTEYLLYDFSLKEGINFKYQRPLSNHEYLFYVKKVDTVEINGIQKKQIQLTLPPNDNIHVTWIENIGSLTGFFYPGGMLDTCGCRMTLLCYFQNNELIYKNPKYSECYYDKPENIVSVQSALNKHNISVYPNPTNDKFIISAPDHTISNVEVFDILGKKVYNQSHGDSIDASSFLKGLYLIKIYDINKQISIFKIIKK